MNDIYDGNETERPYLLFNWIQFESDPGQPNSVPPTRMEARKDHVKIKEILDELGFNQILMDSSVLNANNIVFKDKITEFVETCVKEKNRIKCICVMVSSHGEERKVQVNGADVIEHQIRVKEGLKKVQGETTEKSNEIDDFFISTTRDLIKPFTDKSELENIPKVFLIQACSHQETDTGTDTNVGDKSIDQGVKIQLVDTVQEEYSGLKPVEPLHNRVAPNKPVQASDDQTMESNVSQPSVSVAQECGDNCIVVFSSPSGYKSGSGRAGKGSVLVEALDQALKKMTQQEFSLTEFLLLANKLISEQQDRKLGELAYLPLLRITHQLSMDIRLKKKTTTSN